MRIVLGSMQCEGNSLTPIYTRYEDFDYAAGEDMYEKIDVMPYLRQCAVETVPTIYAHALPGGAVVREDFLRLAKDMVDRIPSEGIDGVWLYLHGAMYVEEIGSGDTFLVRMIREKIGPNVPISLALDFHADNTDELVTLANCITGFRTAPHTDHKRTQLHAVEMLMQCITEKRLPKPQMARANVVICGDAVQTGLEPLKSIMQSAQDMEQTIPGMLSVQVFNGQPWIDAPYMGPSFVVTHQSDPAIAKQCAQSLAKMFYDARHDFGFQVETAQPEQAIRLAMESELPVFLSDSGDNPTAGAAGDNAFLLNRLQKAGAKNVLVAGIADAEACDACYAARIGDTLTLQVGGSLDPNSERACITGKLIHRGDILSYQRDNAGPSATIDCGDITVVITRNRAAMCRPDVFESIDLDWRPYQTVVVKLGYLFPELAQVAKRAILVFTPGSATERLEDMHMKHIRRPMFPLDDDFVE